VLVITKFWEKTLKNSLAKEIFDVAIQEIDLDGYGKVVSQKSLNNLCY
jgi:hypothetical protein